MRKLLFILCLFVIAGHASGQKDIKPASVGFSFGFADFITPARIYESTIHEGLNHGWANVGQTMNPAFMIHYHKGLSTNLDFYASYMGSFTSKLSDKFPDPSTTFFHSIDVGIKPKMFTDKAVFNPYLILGLSALNYKSTFGAQLPWGVGFQFNINDELYLISEAQYKTRLTDGFTDHLFYSFGFSVPLTAKQKAVPPPPPPPPAPVVVAVKVPVDTDKDGIIDSLDKCPEVAGVAKYNGCPIPDTDGDGINDESDKCPDKAGYARYNGCPIPDKDGDGVNDEMDKCPDEPGTPENGGCPTLQQYSFNANNVQFATGNAVLTAGARKELDKGAQILADHPDVKIAIEGHTDNTGNAALNKKAFTERADAVKAYLVGKGISADRLTATGFGSDNPIADNKTKVGRDQNRRVEFKTIH